MTKIQPTCRYGHGDLFKFVWPMEGDDMWSYVNNKNPNLHFSGDLYICKECGYTELFDNDLLATLKQLGAE